MSSLLLCSCSRSPATSFSWPDRFLFRKHLARPPRGLKIPVRVEPMLRGGIPPCFDTERKQQRRAAAYPADQ